MREEYILGVKVNMGLTIPDVVAEVGKWLSSSDIHMIVTTNAEFIMGAQKDSEFRQILNTAALSVPDGAGVTYASYYLRSLSSLTTNTNVHTTDAASRSKAFPIKAFLYGITFGVGSLLKRYPLDPRVTGVELMEKLCQYAAENNKSIFLLGGRMKDKFGRMAGNGIDIAEMTANRLRIKYPGIRIIGATSKFSREVFDDDATIAYIHECMNKSGTDTIDMLFVAYNHPNQEKWLSRNAKKIPVKVCMGVGGSFDYICHTQKRCPKKLIDMNLEWLYKLYTQPWRIRRIFTAFPTFPFKVFMSTISKP